MLKRFHSEKEHRTNKALGNVLSRMESDCKTCARDKSGNCGYEHILNGTIKKNSL